MFNNFITTISSRDDISEEERIMVEHISSAIQAVQNEIDDSPKAKPQHVAVREFDEIKMLELTPWTQKAD
jgi:hypothetical protein